LAGLHNLACMALNILFIIVKIAPPPPFCYRGGVDVACYSMQTLSVRERRGATRRGQHRRLARTRCAGAALRCAANGNAIRGTGGENSALRHCALNCRPPMTLRRVTSACRDEATRGTHALCFARIFMNRPRCDRAAVAAGVAVLFSAKAAA